MLGLILRVLVALVGLAVVGATVGAAIRTVVLPRAIPSKLARAVFLTLRRLFDLRVGRGATYDRRDAVMALYGPVSLLVLLQVWLALAWVGFGLAFLAVDWPEFSGDWWGAWELSGSSLLTLGFDRPNGVLSALLVFAEAATGLILLALLITYLPSLYAAFSRREAQVTKLEVRAGAPPHGDLVLTRAWAMERQPSLTEVWQGWEDWFVDVEETHTTFPALAFFRSPQPDHSWVTAAGAVLDAAALRVSSVDAPRDVDAQLCMRAGYVSLRRIAGFFRLPYDPDPSPDDPIAVTRDEWEEVLDDMARAGVPVRADRDEAWRAFAGWRVNYDRVLVSLAELTMAPYAPWSSDRTLVAGRGSSPLLTRLRSGRKGVAAPVPEPRADSPATRGGIRRGPGRHRGDI